MRINLTDRVFCEQCPSSPWVWDLYQVQPGVRKGELLNVEKPIGVFGITLQKAIEYTPDLHLQLGGEKTIDLKEYMEEFQKIQKEVIKNINESINEFKKLRKNDSI